MSGFGVLAAIGFDFLRPEQAWWLVVAPLLFVQLTYAKPIYSASITSAWLWLNIIGAVIIGYYCLYASAFANTFYYLRCFWFWKNHADSALTGKIELDPSALGCGT